MLFNVKQCISFLIFINAIYLQADIGFKTFKGISEKINHGYKHLNPLWGKIALDNGIIHNLRFYGNFTKGRNYIKDMSNDDPTWNLLKNLFPSPAGSLAASTSAGRNFGKLSTGKPKIVEPFALLPP